MPPKCHMAYTLFKNKKSSPCNQLCGIHLKHGSQHIANKTQLSSPSFLLTVRLLFQSSIEVHITLSFGSIALLIQNKLTRSVDLWNIFIFSVFSTSKSKRKLSSDRYFSFILSQKFLSYTNTYLSIRHQPILYFFYSLPCL